jgi:hypothetical protein
LFWLLFLWYGVWTQDLHFELFYQPFFFWWVFFQIGLKNYLPGLASNWDPPDFCLLSLGLQGMSHWCLDFLFVCFWDWVLLCSPSWPQTPDPLPQPPECWNNKY